MDLVPWSSCSSCSMLMAGSSFSRGNSVWVSTTTSTTSRQLLYPEEGLEPLPDFVPLPGFSGSGLGVAAVAVAAAAGQPQQGGP